MTEWNSLRDEPPFKHSNGRTISIEPINEYVSYSDEEAATYKVSKNWRILATMSIYDMNFLFEMSYALMRRFAFVYLDSARCVTTLEDAVKVLDVENKIAVKDISELLKEAKAV